MRTSTTGSPVNALGSNDDGITKTADLSSSWADCIKLMDPNGRSRPPQSERPCKTLKKGGFFGLAGSGLSIKRPLRRPL